MPSRTMGCFDYRAWPADALICRRHDFAGQLVHVLLHFLVFFAGRWAGEAGMDGVHPSVAIEEDGRRISAELTSCGSVFSICPLSVVPASSRGKVMPNLSR